MRYLKVSLLVALAVVFLCGCQHFTSKDYGKGGEPQKIYWLDKKDVACPPKEEPKPVAAPAPVIPPPVVAKKIEVIPFYFGFDKYNLENQQLAIDKATAALKADPSKKAELQGNCDRLGSVAYNLKLGDRRANTVKSILVKNGIDGKRISTKSFGKSKAVGKTDEERKLDRRVDIILK